MSKAPQFFLLACLGSTVLLGGCGESDAPASTPPRAQDAGERTGAAPQLGEPEADAKPQAAKRARKPIDPRTTGTIRGIVRFEGTPPERKEMAIGNSAGCEHHPVPPLTEDVIVAGGRVQNVFVYVKQGLDDWISPAAPAEPVVLDQTGCMYRPRVIGLRTGQKLSVRNSDGATHNVHSRPERNDGFNRTQPPGGAEVEWTAEKPEVMIPFGCDIHPWMKAWVGVRDHPFFAVSGADGAFSISGLPPGEYALEAWHEKLGKKTGKATLAASETAEIEFVFASK